MRWIGISPQFSFCVLWLATRGGVCTGFEHGTPKNFAPRFARHHFRYPILIILHPPLPPQQTNNKHRKKNHLLLYLILSENEPKSTHLTHSLSKLFSLALSLSLSLYLNSTLSCHCCIQLLFCLLCYT